VVARLARNTLDLDAELADIDAMIGETFYRHRLAIIIVSMPGLGPLLGAELLAATNGDVPSFDTADWLAGVAGLAPVATRLRAHHRQPQTATTI
jgi:transposase